MKAKEKLNVLFAAGGTGGHLFPAVAVAEELEKQNENFNAHFVGNPRKLEAKVIPDKGWNFYPMPITGFGGILSASTITLPFKILKSVLIVRNIIKKYKPEFALCTGAYLSYPAGIAANLNRIPLVLMESNVFPGKTIRMLAPKADLIVTSYSESIKYFPVNLHSRIKCLGNPLRKMFENLPSRAEALNQLGLDANKKTVLIFGGSLGARAINQAALNAFDYFKEQNVQFIWQTGKDFAVQSELPPNVKLFKFIDDMGLVYTAADLVICRSGATSLAEIAHLGKPAVFVPLPSASNDEQASNARVFAENGAALIINNSEIGALINETISQLIFNDEALQEMSNKAFALAKPNATIDTVQAIYELLKR